MTRIRYQPAALRGALWAWRSLRRLRGHLDQDRLASVQVAPPAAVGPVARRGVDAALARGGATCLERSLVVQAFEAAEGNPRDVVVGVSAPDEAFGAHAWLDGDRGGDDFVEIHRIGAR